MSENVRAEFSNLLVSVTDKPTLTMLLACAEASATSDGPLITAVRAIPAPKVPPPMMSHIPTEAEITAILNAPQREAEEVRSSFVRWAEKLGVPYKWACEKAMQRELILKHAAGSDLIVLSSTRSSESFPTRDAVNVIMTSGRPVLDVVNPATTMPKRVLVAWDGSREANRALHDALPLLRGATHVALLMIEEQGKPPSYDVEALCDRMVWAGVAMTPRTEPTSAGREGPCILDVARDEAADLIVMGAYGHSRVGEFWLGGATRTVLQNDCFNVLFSH